MTSYAKSISDLVKKAAAIAKERGILATCSKMCAGCAFKWDQPHTLDYFLAADYATKQLLSGGEFNCHTSDFKDANKRCAGFDMIKKVFGEDY